MYNLTKDKMYELTNFKKYKLANDVDQNVRSYKQQEARY